MKLVIINLITLIRIIGTIILIPLYLKYGGLVVGGIVLLCYITDIIDGFLARFYHASTFFGALFDGFADKTFTLMNFILLYLITPYALIPIVLEILIFLILLYKYKNKYNVKSNILGKIKVWFLAISSVLIYYLSSSNLLGDKLYLIILIPTIILEVLTLISYIKEVLVKKEKREIKKDIVINLEKNTWHNFKNIWLNPEFYESHKDDANLVQILRIKKKSNDK